jgi:hypothetical protein
MAKKLYTKAKQIVIGVYNEGEEDPAVDSLVTLDYVVADSLSINQDDADENTVDCETSDAPILDDYTAGDYKVDLNNASLDADFLTGVMGWQTLYNSSKEKVGYAAPQTFDTRYIALQVKFSDKKYLFLPKIAISPKCVFESLKTNVAYGTLSGTALNEVIPGLYTDDSATKPATSTIATLDAPVWTDDEVRAGKPTAAQTGGDGDDDDK